MNYFDAIVASILALFVVLPVLAILLLEWAGSRTADISADAPCAFIAPTDTETEG